MRRQRAQSVTVVHACGSRVFFGDATWHLGGAAACLPVSELLMTPAPRQLLGLAFSALTLGVTIVPLGAEEPVYFAPGGVALSGYDVVAYLTEGRAVAGSSEHALMWRGATWYFASAESMAEFEMNPQAYAPQFGGYCAYAVAEGQTGTSTPEAFFVYQGKLYIKQDEKMLKSLQARLPEIVAEAQTNWPAALGD